MNRVVTSCWMDEQKAADAVFERVRRYLRLRRRMRSRSSCSATIRRAAGGGSTGGARDRVRADPDDLG